LEEDNESSFYRRMPANIEEIRRFIGKNSPFFNHQYNILTLGEKFLENQKIHLKKKIPQNCLLMTNGKTISNRETSPTFTS
jgi:hypothetical protein